MLLFAYLATTNAYQIVGEGMACDPQAADNVIHVAYWAWLTLARRTTYAQLAWPVSRTSALSLA